MRSMLRRSVGVTAFVCLGVTLVPAWSLQPTPKDADPKPPTGMVLVPKGGFYLGDTEDELEALFKQIEKKNPGAEFWTSLVKPADQKAAQLAAPVFLDKTEVTNAQYDIYLKATGEQPPSVKIDDNRVLSDWEPTADGKGFQLKKGRENHPVYGVSYFQAEAFARWAGKRLPTEQEWERAARGEDKRRYPWGNQWNDRKYCNSALYGANDTTPVGTFPEGASPYGLLDMAGNVWEWTSSTFDLYPGNTKATGQEGGMTIRGGGFPQVAHALRSSVRIGLSPTFRTLAIGFRCAKGVVEAVDALQLTTEALRGLFPGDFKYDPKGGVGIEKTEYAPGSALITRYTAIGVVPATEVNFNQQKMLETTHKNKKAPIPLFVFRTDVDLENPRIPAGQYLVLYDAPGSIVTPAATPGDTAAADKDKKEDEAAPPPAPADASENGGKDGGKKEPKDAPPKAGADKAKKAEADKAKKDEKGAKKGDAKKDAGKETGDEKNEAGEAAEAGEAKPSDAPAADAAVEPDAKEGGDPATGDPATGGPAALSTSAQAAANLGALSKEAKAPRLVFQDVKGRYRAEILNPVFGSETEAKSEVTLDEAKKTVAIRAVPRYRLSGKQLVFEHTFTVTNW